MPKPPNTRRWLLCVVVLGVVLRGIFLLRYARYPADPRFVADPYAYLMMAERAYHGHFFVSFRGFPTSYLSVGYPALVAIVQHLFLGVFSTWGTCLALNLICYVLTTLGIVQVARIYLQRVNATPQTLHRVMMTCAGLLAVYPDSIFATGVVMSEFVAVAFLVWCVVFLSRLLDGGAHRWVIVLCGLFAGMAVFVRPSLVFLVVLVPGVLIIRRQWRVALAVFACALVPLVPLWWNNSRVGTGPGITSATWMNVCDGLLKADGTFQWRPECRVDHSSDEIVTPRTEALNTAHAKRLALQEISNHPLAWISRMPLRLYHSLWSGGWVSEVSVKWGQNYRWTEHMKYLRLLSRRFFDVVALLGFCGITTLVRKKAVIFWPIAVIAVGTLAGVPISFGQARFGWPLAMLVLVPYSAIFINDALNFLLVRKKSLHR